MAATTGPIRKNCNACDGEFIAGSGSAKFCSDKCNVHFNTIKLASNGCWLWVGYKDKDGYGVAKFSGGRRVKAHRAAYELSKGPIPNGMMVCHSCDNPGCVNPVHLFAGTALDNKSDCVSKGRHVRGEALYWKVKLNEADVLSVLNDGRHRSEVARSYGVTPELIDAIRKRKIWKHLGGALPPAVLAALGQGNVEQNQ